MVEVRRRWRRFRASGRPARRIRQAAAATATTAGVMHLQQQVGAGVLFSGGTRQRGQVCGGGRGRTVVVRPRRLSREHGRAFGAAGQFRQNGLRQPRTRALGLALQVHQRLQVRQVAGRRRGGRRWRPATGVAGGGRGAFPFAAVVKRIPPADRLQEILPGLARRRRGTRQFGARLVFQYAAVFAF